MTDTPAKSASLRLPWGLWAITLPLCLQIALVISVPLQAAIARTMGTSVVLRTVPVDPYDPFRGYYTTLRYDISQRGILSTLEGWDQIKSELEPDPAVELLEPGRVFYVILQAPAATTGSRLAPWQPVAVTRDRPRDLPEQQIALRGVYRSDRILYGLERYYLPEAQRLELEQRIRDAQTGDDSPRLQVEVRIGPLGNAVPIALWLGNERLEL